MSASTSTTSDPAALRPENRPYRPRGAAAAVLYDRSPQVLLSGPAGTGKSRAALEKLHLVAEKHAGARLLIVRKTRASCTESCLVTYEEKVLPSNHPALASGVQRRTRHGYDYPNGSSLVVGGMDNPAKVLSTEWDLVYVNEATELGEDDWENLASRLRNGVVPYQQLIADCNPSGPSHWLKRKCDAGAVRLLESRHEDNPLFWDLRANDWTERGRSYIATLDALTGVRKPRLRHGRWVAAEGVVYDEFDAGVHLVDRFEVPRGWPRFRSIDFGYTNPFVCQWWALDDDGRMYLYREVYMTGRTVRAHAERIRALEAEAGEEVESTVADHDAEDRATLAEHGIESQPASKEVGPGIEAVKERLRPAGDGRPRVLFLRDALVERDESLAAAKRPCGTVDEFDCYVWTPSRDGRADREAPVKLHDHGMDALRYACRQADGRGVRWIGVS